MEQLEDRIKDTFQHAASMSEEFFKESWDNWREIQKNIIEKSTNDNQKCKCGVYWNNSRCIFNGGDIRVCAMCDQYINPHLSNPINRKYVLEYIPEKYHSMIFGTYVYDIRFIV